MTSIFDALEAVRALELRWAARDYLYSMRRSQLSEREVTAIRDWRIREADALNAPVLVDKAARYTAPLLKRRRGEAA